MNYPLIIPRSEHNVSRTSISPEALKVLYRLKEGGYIACLAGGGVRDLLLGRKPKDFDIVTDATPNEVRRMFRNCMLIGRRFRLAHVRFLNETIEVATFRADSSPDPSAAQSLAEQETMHDADHHHEPAPGPGQQTNDRRKPLHVHLKREDGLIIRDNVFGTPSEDARRRDFTINALFYNIDDFSIIDFVGGLADLKHGLIRSIGNPAGRYAEDPVRMIRAVRFASLLNFKIEHHTLEAIHASHQALAKASNARLFEEVLKLFLSGAADKAQALLIHTGLLGTMFPQFTAWLRQPEHGNRIAAFSEACRQIDHWIMSGKTVAPAVLFTMLFGDYHVWRASHLERDGVPRNPALATATLQHLSDLAERVFIPKRVADQIIRLLIAKPDSGELISEHAAQTRHPRRHPAGRRTPWRPGRGHRRRSHAGAPTNAGTSGSGESRHHGRPGNN